MNLQNEIAVEVQIIMDTVKSFNSLLRKRDLSDQSCNSEETKRAREGSLSDYNVLLSSHRRCSVKKGVLKNFAKFTGKHLCPSL